MSTVSGKCCSKNSSCICFINQTVYTHITDCVIIMNCTCVYNVSMHCTGVILVEIIVVAVGYCIQVYYTSLFIGYVSYG